MITINDKAVQALVDALKKQREDALDAVAIHASTITALQNEIAELKAKLPPAPEPPKSK